MKAQKIIILLFLFCFINTIIAQEIETDNQSIKINNTPALYIEKINLIDENRNNQVDAGENCFLEIILKNTGNGVAKAVNLDAIISSGPVKGFSWAKSVHVGNLVDGKQKKIKLELYPKISLRDGSIRLKVEALEANGYNSKPKQFTLKLKSKGYQLAVGWNAPLGKKTTVYEPDYIIETCIVSNSEIKQVKVYLNGELYTDKRGLKLIKSYDCDYIIKSELKLRSGANRVNVKVVNKDRLATSETRFINYIETRLENRLALIIGNSNYKFAPLRNPENDARDMATALRNLNFDVIEIIDGNKKAMRDAVRDFSDRLEKDKGMGLFYYAGHGIQVKGENFLVPVKHNIQEEFEVQDEAIRVNTVLAAMETSGTRMNIVILDACRDNPYARSMRSGSRGLAQIYAEGSGSIIAYATSPGSVAADGSGKNGLYTQELLKAINTRDLEIGMVFRKVLSNVKKLSNGKQVPWTNASIEGEFYFKK